MTRQLASVTLRGWASILADGGGGGGGGTVARASHIDEIRVIGKGGRGDRVSRIIGRSWYRCARAGAFGGRIPLPSPLYSSP